MAKEMLASHSAWIDESDQPAPPSKVEPDAKRSWTRHAWILLAIVILAFLSYYVWPRYIALDPSKTFARLRPDFPLHYPIVVVHVITGNIALLTACLQVWPWLRERHPTFHRVSGRLYVFAGALPCSLVALPLLVLKGPAASTSTFFWAAAWFVTTVIGFRKARQSKYSEHRRWMAYSIAVGAAIIWNGVIGDLAFRYPTHVNLKLVFDLLVWLPGVTNLVIAHLLVNRAERRESATTFNWPC
jgi:Predicted membrane protein (DUF2306)